MKTLSRKNWLFIILAVLCVFVLGYFLFVQKQAPTVQKIAEKVSEIAPTPEVKELENIFCYTQKNQVTLGKDKQEAFHYDFVNFEIDKENKVTGSFQAIPPEGEIVSGEFFGDFNPQDQKLSVNAKMMLNGDEYREERVYEKQENQLVLIPKNEGQIPFVTFTTPCSEYEKLILEAGKANNEKTPA